MDHQIRIRHLLQRRPERLHQVVGQVPHEADRVGDRAVTPARQVELAHGGVEGGEERVLHEHARTGEPIEQARLACIRVARQGHGRRTSPLARPALGTAYPLHLLELAAQHGHLVADSPAIGLDLGLARTTRAHATGCAPRATARLARQRLAPAPKAREEVLHLRERHLRATGLAARVLGEDVKDEPRAVDDLHLDDILEMPQLAGTELTVADHRVRARGDHEVAQFASLAGADVRRGIGAVATLDDPFEHEGARSLRQGRKLAQAALRLLRRAVRPHPDEHDLLQANLAVLDLGDVLELGRQADDATQGLPVLEIEFADGGLV